MFRKWFNLNIIDNYLLVDIWFIVERLTVAHWKEGLTDLGPQLDIG